MSTEAEQLREKAYVLSYILNFWKGYLEGFRLAIHDHLSARFNHVPTEIVHSLERVPDIKTLRDLNKQSVTVSSLEDFKDRLAELKLEE